MRGSILNRFFVDLGCFGVFFDRGFTVLDPFFGPEGLLAAFETQALFKDAKKVRAS